MLGKRTPSVGEWPTLPAVGRGVRIAILPTVPALVLAACGGGEAVAGDAVVDGDFTELADGSSPPTSP